HCSSPTPTTNTSSHASADEACGAFLELLSSPVLACAALVAAVADELADADKAPKAGGAGGNPTAVPLTLMLLAPSTAVAAIVRLPATIPASFALTTPCGAKRSTSPGLVPSEVASA